MKPAEDSKARSLASHGALHPRPGRVRDPLFQGSDFFDPRDLVQVRYEMLRRHLVDGQPVAGVARTFGMSRQMFYLLARAFREEGLPGLLPRKRGPKRARKATDEVLDLRRRPASGAPRPHDPRAGRRRVAASSACGCTRAPWSGGWHAGEKNAGLGRPESTGLPPAGLGRTLRGAAGEGLPRSDAPLSRACPAGSPGGARLDVSRGGPGPRPPAQGTPGRGRNSCGLGCPAGPGPAGGAGRASSPCWPPSSPVASESSHEPQRQGHRRPPDAKGLSLHPSIDRLPGRAEPREHAAAVPLPGPGGRPGLAPGPGRGHRRRPGPVRAPSPPAAPASSGWWPTSGWGRSGSCSAWRSRGWPATRRTGTACWSCAPWPTP